jgi:hypothetical protein
VPPKLSELFKTFIITVSMKDWKLTAKAWNLPIPDQDLDNLTGPLNGLEATFRPLAQTLQPEDESSLLFRLDGNGK